jgi:hypothetical protein
MTKNISKKNFNKLNKLLDKIYEDIIKDISIRYNIKFEELEKNEKNVKNEK